MPFTCKVTGSILSASFLNVAQTQSSTQVKRVSQHSAESRGFSIWAIRFPPTGKLTGWVRTKHRYGSKIAIVVKIASLG